MKQYSFLEENFFKKAKNAIFGSVDQYGESIPGVVGKGLGKLGDYIFGGAIALNKKVRPHRALRGPVKKIFKLEDKFLNSKYAFPIAMHAYGWGTITLPSGSMYAIGFGFLPQEFRKTVIRQLRHAKSAQDVKSILSQVTDAGYENVIKYFHHIDPNPLGNLALMATPETLAAKIAEASASKVPGEVVSAVKKVKNGNPVAVAV